MGVEAKYFTSTSQMFNGIARYSCVLVEGCVVFFNEATVFK